MIQMARSEDDKIQKFGALALSRLAFTGGDVSTKIAEKGGLRILIKFGYSKNREWQAQAALALQGVALNHSIQDQLVNEGGIQLLEKLSRSNDEEVKMNAKRSMSNFYATLILTNLAIHASYSQDSTPKAVDAIIINKFFEKFREEDRSVNVLRVCLLAFSNFNREISNMKVFLRQSGMTEICELIDPEQPKTFESEEMKIFKKEIIKTAILCIENGAIDDEVCKNMIQGFSTIPNLLKISSFEFEKDPEILVAGCSALEKLCKSSKALAQKRIIDEKGLDVLLDLLNRSTEVKIAAAKVLSALATNRQYCVRIIQENALAGLLMMLSSEDEEVVTPSVDVLSQLCLAPENHHIITQKITCSALAELFRIYEHSVPIKISAAEMIMRVAEKDSKFGFHTKVFENKELLQALVNMLRATDKEQLTSAKCLSTLVAFNKIREKVKDKEMNVIDSLSTILKSSNQDVREAAAELLSSLVDMGDGAKQEVINATTVGALIALTDAGDSSKLARAAEALAQIANSYEGKQLITDLGGVAAMKKLGASQNTIAVKSSLKVMKALSALAKNQITIAEEALDWILETLKNNSVDEEVTELALEIIANLAINAQNKAKIEQAGGREILNQIASQSTPMAPFAQKAIRNMESSKRLSELSAGSSNFLMRRTLKANDVKGILRLLQDNADKENSGVEREISRVLGSVAENADNVNMVLQEKGVSAISQLVKSPDLEVQKYVCQAIAKFSLHDKARAALTDEGITESVCRLVSQKPFENNFEKIPPENQIEILTALANLCSSTEKPKNALKILRCGFLPVLVNVISNDKFDDQVKYQAAIILSSMNYVPDD